MMEAKQQLDLAKRIKAIAETGLVYAQDDYDKERYTELREISVELMAQLAKTPIKVLDEFFIPQKDYPTPKVDVRAFVLNENQEILMAKERSDGKWTIPGGWSDVGCTPSEVAIKEVQEETGLEVSASRVLAIYDKQRHAHPNEPIYVYKMVFHCVLKGGELKAGFDMLDAAFFPLDKLPELSEIRILESQLQQLHQMVKQDQKEVYFD